MDKPKNQVREVLYRSDNGAIEIVLLTCRTSQGCTHNVYLKREGKRAGPTMFLGFTKHIDCEKAHQALSLSIKFEAKNAMLSAWREIYQGQ